LKGDAVNVIIGIEHLSAAKILLVFPLHETNSD
jgi:hypothetical protein